MGIVSVSIPIRTHQLFRNMAFMRMKSGTLMKLTLLWGHVQPLRLLLQQNAGKELTELFGGIVIREWVTTVECVTSKGIYPMGGWALLYEYYQGDQSESGKKWGPSAMEFRGFPRAMPLPIVIQPIRNLSMLLSGIESISRFNFVAKFALQGGHLL